MYVVFVYVCDDFFVIDVDFKYVVDGDVGRFQRIGLGNCARKTVEQVVPGAIWLFQVILHQVDDDVVGNQFVGVYDLLGFEVQRRAGVNCGVQHVAGGNLGNFEAFGDEICLGVFVGSWRSKKN